MCIRDSLNAENGTLPKGGGAGSRRNQHRLHILFGNPALCISDGNTIDRICRAVPAVDHVLRDRNLSTEPYGSNEIRLPAEMCIRDSA